MKFRNLKIAIGALATVASVSAFADQSQIDTFSKQLSQVRAAELPREAAALVSAAKLESQESTAADVVRAALKVNPASAPLLVGAIARSATKTAPVACEHRCFGPAETDRRNYESRRGCRAKGIDSDCCRACAKPSPLRSTPWVSLRRK
jgi:hypothetical protein